MLEGTEMFRVEEDGAGLSEGSGGKLDLGGRFGKGTWLRLPVHLDVT